MTFDYKAEYMNSSCKMDIFVARYVNVPYFLKCCSVCRNFDKKWSCPRYHFNQLAYWNSFSEIKLFGAKLIMDKSLAESNYEGDVLCFIERSIHREKGRLMQVIWDLEKKIPGSRGLFAGDCQLCAKCAKADGIPCRHPDLMRYSVESIGGDVTAVTEDLLGTKILWVKDNKVPEYFTLVTGLLLK